MNRSTITPPQYPNRHCPLLLVLLGVFAYSALAFSADFQPNDQVSLKKDGPLLFLDKPLRQGMVGETFKVLAYQPAQKKVFLATKDPAGKEIAVSVTEDSVGLVPADKTKVQADVLAAVSRQQYTSAKALLDQALRASPDDADLRSTSTALETLVKSAAQLNQVTISQRTVADDLQRRRRNADVTDHPNLLDAQDQSGRQRAAEIRTEANKLEVKSTELVRTAQANYDAASSALKGIIQSSLRAKLAGTKTKVAAQTRQNLDPRAGITSTSTSAKPAVSPDIKLLLLKSARMQARFYLLAASREIENIKDKSSKEACLEDIAVAQGEADDKTAALATIKEQRPGGMSRLAGALTEAGDVPAALEVAADPGVYDRNEVLSWIAMAQAKSGDVSAALRTIADVKNDDAVSDALRSISSAQAKAGDVPSALQTAARIGSTLEKSIAMYDIAAAQAKTGDVQTAIRTALSIEDKDSRAFAIHEIAAAQVLAGDVAGARQTIYSIKDGHVQSVGLAGMALAQAQTGDMVGVHDTVEKIWEDGWWDIAHGDIAHFQAGTGDIAGALSTVKHIHTGSTSLQAALVNIATAQAKAGNTSAAIVTAKQ